MALEEVRSEDEQRRDRNEDELEPEEEGHPEELRLKAVIDGSRQR